MPGPRPTIPRVQMAAGGVVWQHLGKDAKLVLVHRPKYDDWTLPKGKAEEGETLAETAYREVNEEIAQDVEMLNFAGVVHYPTGQRITKVVLFWHMLARGDSRFEPNREIDGLIWLSREEALRKLSYEVEKALLRAVQPPI